MFSFKTESIFGQTKQLEREIDQFVDILSEVGLVFKSIVPIYLIQKHKPFHYLCSFYIV